MRLQADGLISHLFASNVGRDEKEGKARSCVEMKDYKEATNRILCDPSDFFEESSAPDTELRACDQFRAVSFYRIMGCLGIASPAGK